MTAGYSRWSKNNNNKDAMAVCLEGWAAIFYLKKNKQRTDFLTRKRFDIRAMYSRVSVEPKPTRVMKRLLMAASAVFLLSGTVCGQTPQFSVVASGAWTSNGQPLAQAGGYRVQWLLLPGDFGQTPLPGMISRIYIQAATTPASDPEFANFTVRMQQTDKQQMTAPWTALPDTVFYSTTHTFTGVSQNQWVPLDLQTPFYYDGVSGLIVEILHSGATNGFSVNQDNTLLNRRIHGAPTAANGSAAPGMLAFGYDRGGVTSNNAAVSTLAAPAGAFCQGTQDVKVEILNAGSNQLDSVEVHWQLDGVTQTPAHWRSLLDTPGGGNYSAVVTLGAVSFGPAPRTIKAWIEKPNGQPDPFAMDDTLTVVVASALEGTYTIGGTLPDFSSINAAADALNSRGVCGHVTFNIRDGNYSDQRAVLNAITGAGPTARITFKSESNDATKVTLSFDAPHNDTNHIFRLNDASYITIRDLTLRPVNATRHKAIEIFGSSSYDSIVNCHILMPGPVGTPINNHKTGIFGNTLTGDAKYNVIANNIIEHGAFGIYWYASNANKTYNHVFSGNTITGYGSKGMDIRYAGRLTISDNTFSGTGTGTYYGIQCQDADSGQYIAGNRITLVAASPYGVEMSNCMAHPGAMSRIENNRIHLEQATSVSYGIRSQTTSYAVFLNNVITLYGTAGTAQGLYGTGSNVSYYHNSVRITGNHATNTAAGYFSHNVGTNAVIRNNIFYNAGSVGLGMFSYYATGIDADYNNVYSASGDLFRKSSGGNVTYTSLADWQAASGQERHSIAYPPAFLDTITLEPDPADSAVWSIHGRGEHLTTVPPLDINGVVRPVVRAAGVPDLGAYEFTATSVPPAAEASPAAPAAGVTQVFTFGGDTVARISWAAAAQVPATVTVRPYSGVQPPALGVGRYMYFYTDISAPAGVYNYTAHIHYKEPWRGVMDTESDIRLAKKNSSLPWVLYGGSASSVDVNANLITAAGLTDFSLFTGTDALISPACSGVPDQADITTAPVTICAGDSALLTAMDPNEQTGVTGLSYQWQQATAPAGPWNNVSGGNGATTLSYQTPALSASTYYRLRVSCSASGQVSYSDTFLVTVLTPQPVTVTTASHCGPGSLMLGATGTAPVIWYENATGGQSLDTGTSFTTPHLSATTVYYVQAGNQCGARTPVSAIIYTLPDADITTTGSTTFCSGDSVVLASADTYEAYRWQRDGTVLPGATQQAYTVFEGGAYRLIVTDTNSCMDTSAPVNVTVYPRPEPEITFDGIVFSVSAAFSAYQWHLDGADIPGATDREHTPQEPGVYTVTVDDEKGCYATSEPYHLHTAVPGIAGAEAIHIYPNPVRDVLHIFGPQPIHATLSAADGKTVLRQENVTRIDMRSLPSGVYILRITNAENVLLRTERVARMQ
jgi:hypothetical protein